MYFCFLFQFPGIGSAERMEKVMEAYVQMGTTEQEGRAGQTDKAGQTEKNGLTANAAPTAENVPTQRGFQRETRRQLTGPESESAIRLYRRNGFEEISAYYENPMDDVLYFRRKLIPPQKGAEK